MKGFWRMKKQVYIIISIVLVILIALLALANTAATDINFLFTTIKMPLILLILVCLLIGAFFMFVLSMSSAMKKNSEIKNLKNEVEQTKRELGQKTEELERRKKNADTQLGC